MFTIRVFTHTRSSALGGGQAWWRLSRTRCATVVRPPVAPGRAHVDARGRKVERALPAQPTFVRSRGLLDLFGD